MDIIKDNYELLVRRIKLLSNMYRKDLNIDSNQMIEDIDYCLECELLYQLLKNHKLNSDNLELITNYTDTCILKNNILDNYHKYNIKDTIIDLQSYTSLPNFLVNDYINSCNNIIKLIDIRINKSDEKDFKETFFNYYFNIIYDVITNIKIKEKDLLLFSFINNGNDCFKEEEKIDYNVKEQVVEEEIKVVPPKIVTVDDILDTHEEENDDVEYDDVEVIPEEDDQYESASYQEQLWFDLYVKHTEHSDFEYIETFTSVEEAEDFIVEYDEDVYQYQLIDSNDEVVIDRVFNYSNPDNNSDNNNLYELYVLLDRVEELNYVDSFSNLEKAYDALDELCVDIEILGYCITLNGQTVRIGVPGDGQTAKNGFPVDGYASAQNKQGGRYKLYLVTEIDGEPEYVGDFESVNDAESFALTTHIDCYYYGIVDSNTGKVVKDGAGKDLMNHLKNNR